MQHIPYARVFPLYFEHVMAGLVCMVCETQYLLTLQYTQFIRKYLSAETRIIQKLVIWPPLRKILNIVG